LGCASFGGALVRNAAGAFEAKNEEQSPAARLCGRPRAHRDAQRPPWTRLPARNRQLPAVRSYRALGQWILDRNCPDVIALQEVWSSSPGVDVLSNVRSRLVGICPDDYRIAF
jgi:hypothetical protein